MIRTATIEDIAAIQLIARITWADTYLEIIPQTIQDEHLGLTYGQDVLEREVSEGLYSVVVDDGLIVGFARSHEEDNTLIIDSMYILPTSQNAGFGKELLKGLIKKSSLEVESVIAEILYGTEKSQQFYENNDFDFLENKADSLFGQPLKTVRYIKYI